MTHVKRGFAAAWLALAPMTALAEQSCFLSYATFEDTVRHADLDICPGEEMKPEDGFCRIAISGATFFLYVFRHMEGEPCLVAVRHYDANDFLRRFGPRYERP